MPSSPSKQLLTNITIFTSGLSAIFYQMTWIKEFSSLLGSGALASAAVITLFMIGMGLGALIVTPLQHRLFPQKPGLMAAATFGLRPLAALLVIPAAQALTALTGATPTAIILRILPAAPMLLLATILIGISTPLYFTILEDGMQVKSAYATIYSINTAGAILGALLPVMGLFASLGLFRSLLLVACLDLFVAAVFWQHHRKALTSLPPPPRLRTQAVYLAPLGYGFVVFAYELAWTRSLALFFDNTVTVFALILATILAGNYWGGTWAQGCKEGARCPAQSATRSITIAVIWAQLSVFAYKYLFFAYVMVKTILIQINTPTWANSLLQLIIVALPVLPPSYFLGRAYPMIVAYLHQKDAHNNRAEVVGLSNSYHNLGAILGTACCGLWLLPTYGTATVLALCCGAAALTVWILTPQYHLSGALLLLGALAIWPGADPTFASAMSSLGFERRFAKEDTVGLIEVFERENGTLILSTNRQQQEGDTSKYSLKTQKGQAQLAKKLAPTAQKVLSIGLGTGISLGPLLSLPELQELQVVELSPAVGRTATLFKEFNQHLLSDPRTKLSIGDGRNYLQHQMESQYDLIIADNFTPYNSGVGDLYTLEHYQACARALKSDGIMVQWLPLRQLTPRQVGIITATFAAAFPTSFIWCPEQFLALIGSSAAQVSALNASTTQQKTMSTKRYLQAYPAPGVNTEDHPRIEYDTSFDVLAVYRDQLAQLTRDRIAAIR